MTRMTVSLPDDLAEMVKERQRADGYATPDEAAAALISEALVVGKNEDHSAGYSDDALRQLLDEADASGPAEPWNAGTVRAEVLRRYAALTAG